MNHSNDLTTRHLAEEVINLLDLEDTFQKTKKYQDLAKYKEKRMALFLSCADILKEE